MNKFILIFLKEIKFHLRCNYLQFLIHRKKLDYVFYTHDRV